MWFFHPHLNFQASLVKVQPSGLCLCALSAPSHSPLPLSTSVDSLPPSLHCLPPTFHPLLQWASGQGGARQVLPAVHRRHVRGAARGARAGDAALQPRLCRAATHRPRGQGPPLLPLPRPATTVSGSLRSPWTLVVLSTLA
ncbi:unnamed protein product, partial [Closterium sp. NIES-54]